MKDKRMVSYKTLITVLAAGLSLMTVSACGVDPETGGSAGAKTGVLSGKIVAASAYDTDNYNPFTTASALALSANWHTLEGLTELDPVTRLPYPALAAQMPEKIDELHWKVTLRENAKFSDGSEVDAVAVESSFADMLNEEVSPLYAPMLSFIGSVKAANKDIMFTLKYPYSLFSERISLVKIVKPDQTEEQLASNPIGSGPFKMDKAEMGVGVNFSANSYYNGSRPAKVAKMEWKALKSDPLRTAVFQRGKADAIESVAFYADKLASAHGEVGQVQGFNLAFLMFNTKKPPFNDVRVRQAMLYAINVPALIEGVLGGEAAPATSFLPEGNANYHRAKVVYDYNPEKAKQLLTQAGVSNLDMTLNSTDHAWLLPMAPMIVRDLQAVGINAHLSVNPSSATYKEIIDAGQPFDVLFAPGDPSVFGSDPDILMGWWYGDNVWSKDRYKWSDTAEFARLQSLLTQAAQSVGSEQQQAWNDSMDLISEQVPLYPLFHRSVLTGWNEDKLDGFKPIGLTGLSFLDVGIK